MPSKVSSFLAAVKPIAATIEFLYKLAIQIWFLFHTAPYKLEALSTASMSQTLMYKTTATATTAFTNRMQERSFILTACHRQSA